MEVNFKLDLTPVASFINSETLRQVITVIAVMLTLDVVWLTANSAYHRQVFAELQSKPLQVRWIPAAFVYVLMIVGVWFFAVAPSTTWTEAAWRGALIGLVMYGLYDLTNYATLAAYPLHYTLKDMAWGTVLCAATAAAAKAF
jgi:uncharacterized membrane protein